ncbi:FAD-dependent thymidylate synthase [Terrihabitans soli]|nr:FAD-dependent thymidylate synthase [Terrihabitans soli]
MTTISAKIIADSVSQAGIRLTSLQLRYPRFIHAELMTHRAFSRNASSSRAIPVSRLIDDMRRDPAMPIHWGKNQKGMQADEECNERVNLGPSMGLAHEFLASSSEAWIHAMNQAIAVAEAFDAAGFHKQVVNRLLEPFSHINVLVTATDFANFFALRLHKDAEPHIRILAGEMKAAMDTSIPTELHPGEWHLPYVTKEDWAQFPPDLIEGGDGYSYDEALENLMKVSVARCARLSYLTYEGKRSWLSDDIALYEKLVVAEPMHASPAEHQATPDTYSQEYQDWDTPSQHGNLRGWRQHRKMLANEAVPG